MQIPGRREAGVMRSMNRAAAAASCVMRMVICLLCGLTSSVKSLNPGQCTSVPRRDTKRYKPNYLRQFFEIGPFAKRRLDTNLLRGSLAYSGGGNWAMPCPRMTRNCFAICCINNAKFDQFVLSKITKTVASRCQIVRQKCTKFDLGRALHPRKR